MAHQRIGPVAGQWLLYEFYKAVAVAGRACWLIFATMSPSSDLDWAAAIEASEAIVAESDWAWLNFPLAVSHYRTGNLERAREVFK